MTRSTGRHLLSDLKIRAWLSNPTAAALHDGGGLYLRRRSDGAYWSLRQTNGATGRPTWAAILPGLAYPAATLSKARAAAAEARTRQAQGGLDLVRHRAAARQKARDEAAAAELEKLRRLTVRQLFERWQGAELAPQVQADGTRTGRKDGGEWVRKAFERRLFPTLGHVAAEDVRRADLLALIDEAKAGGTLRTAQVLLADLRQMFRFAVEREIVATNPLEGIRRSKIVGRPTERERVLSDAELTALARAAPLAGLAPRTEAAIWLILATATRVGECMGAVWAGGGDVRELRAIAEKDEATFGIVDAKAGTWHMPTTKNEREHTIHLSAFALRQLARLADLREVGEDGKPVPWLFPSADRARPVCVKSFGKQLADRQREPEKRMANRSKATRALALPDGKWTAHDLRRTAATVMARLGVSTDVIDECLNHKLQSKVARVYIRDRREADQRRAFDALGRRLVALVDGQAGEPGNVVPLRAA